MEQKAHRPGIQGNYKSDIDLALKAAKEKAVEQLKSAGQTGMSSLVQQQVQQTKVDILRDTKIASGLEFEVSEIEVARTEDRELTFKYDITNNSGIDYKKQSLIAAIHFY